MGIYRKYHVGNKNLELYSSSLDWYVVKHNCVT